MIYWLLLLFSIVLTVCKSALYNAYAQKNAPSLQNTFGFNAVSYALAAAVALIGLLFGTESISLPTVLCAFFYATIVVSLQTISITAMRVGAMSTTSICVMYGMIIPSVAGPIFWKEPIGALQIVGIVLMVVSLWFIKEKSAKEQKPASKKWVLLAIPAFILSGMAGVMEKIHQSTQARAERMSFVFIACSFMLVFSIAARLFTKKKEEKKQASSALVLAALSGIVIGLCSTVNLILSGKLDSMIYYPIANGGAMLLTVAVSALVFKEHFNKTRWIGTVMGLVGILCLSLPI